MNPLFLSGAIDGLDGFYFESLSWDAIILRLVLSLVAGMLIGLERKISNHPAGMKTHALVCIGSALASLITLESGNLAAQLSGSGDYRVDLSRIAAGVLTGIGFVGAGAIMKSRDGVMVTGLTTSATLWVTACLGLAIGMGFLKISLVALLTVFIANVLLRYLEIKLHLSTKNTKAVIIATTSKNKTIEELERLFNDNKILIEDFELAGADEQTLLQMEVQRLIYTLKLSRSIRFDVLLRDIACLDGIVQVVETVPGTKI